ncbi:Ig-like domain-containing protein [Clostridium intestinale]|uniref:Uncharacterized conserved protein YjdB, contains Ig-like domain n=1 Tax=Clostridium intestinale DSM 6191 TaxID=1121320 RepID=A0A1M6AJG9_9CLOT|nr:Ig-like domain-containing protein [Clostridium intestinale]SHI36622.1 Uncharacterized conserved protein YjdB, contains Ig-like domain [Clostridium intestinale DSM 6191]
MKKKISLVLSIILAFTFVTFGNVKSVKAEEKDAVIGISNLNNTDENSAKVGEQLKLPEKGWKRYDNTEVGVVYIGNYREIKDPYYYKSSCASVDVNGEVNFKFSGTKLRIIGLIYPNTLTTKAEVYIDNVLIGNINEIGNHTYKAIVFEKLDLSDSIHTCKIVNKEKLFHIDAIDIDEIGYLIDASTVAVSEISLNKTSLSLNIGENEDLIVTVKPDNAENKKVAWTSSDESIATVDENGKVTAIKPGSVTITAKTKDGTNLAATCAVTVVQPSNDRAILAITMTNGQTKEYDLPNSEIEAFTNWFDSSNGKGQPKFGFNKKIQPYKEVKEYVVFDKISSYEVRTYTVIN